MLKISPHFRLLLFLLLMGLVCATNPHHQIEQTLITEGKSIGDFNLGMTKGEITSKLGNNYKLIKWKDHSYEMRYSKFQMSFWYLQSDQLEKVFSISVSNKFNGITTKGLEIHKNLKVKDIIAIYGKPEWGTTKDEKELDCEYYDLGIYFEVKQKRALKKMDVENLDSLYANLKVTDIVIGEPEENF